MFTCEVAAVEDDNFVGLPPVLEWGDVAIYRPLDGNFWEGGEFNHLCALCTQRYSLVHLGSNPNRFNVERVKYLKATSYFIHVPFRY